MGEKARTTTLLRDCVAIQIPSGTPLSLSAGTSVVVSQAMGDSFTVTTDRGWMARIAGVDADALGLEPVRKTVPEGAPQSREDIERSVWDALRNCYDPEIPVNVVELGLIYGCELLDLPDGRFDVRVRFTLTTPACGMAGVLQADIEDKAESVPGVRRAEVEIVFDPPWDQSRMSEAAKLELGIF